MIRRHWVWVVPVAAALTTAVVWPSRAQEPPKTTTEKIKAKVGSAVDSIKRGAASAEGAIKEQYARARSGVIAMGIEARVYARLHWDKALYGTKIDLSWPKEGVITLSGMVPDERVKAKAIELTRDTVGVTEVVDHLTVQTRTIPAPATPAPAAVKP